MVKSEVVKPEAGRQTVIHIGTQVYKVEGESLTVREILELRLGSQADLSTKLLVRRHGNDTQEYPNLAEKIAFGPAATHFIILDTSPTPVS